MTDENQKPAVQEVPKATPSDLMDKAVRDLDAAAKQLGIPVVLLTRQRGGAIGALRMNASVGDAIGLCENGSVIFSEDMRAEYSAMKALESARKQ